MSRKSVSHNRLTKGQLPLTPRFEYAREISKIKGGTLRHRGDEQQEQVGEPREHGLIPVRRAAQIAVMHARPYPRLALRRELHLEYPSDHHAVLEHVLVLQVIAEGGAFEDQRGHHGGGGGGGLGGRGGGGFGGLAALIIRATVARGTH